MDSWHQFFLLPVAPVLCLLVAQWVEPEQILAAVAPTLALFLALLVKMLTFFFVTDDKIL
jgi:hypothetical protein